MIFTIYTDIEKPLHLKSSHILQISIKRLDKLTDEDMQHLLQFKGGTFIPEYLATDSASAEMNFPNARLMRFRRNYDRVGGSQQNIHRLAKTQDTLIYRQKVTP